MGGTNMQRGSSSTMRTVMIFSLGSLVVVTILYLAKRVEVNNTVEELELTRLESRDMSDQLNNKISIYEADVDSLTQTNSVLNSKITTCESQRIQCEEDFSNMKDQKDKAAAMLTQAIDARDSAVNEKAAMEHEVAELRDENMQLADDYDACEDEKEDLNLQNDEGSQCSVQLAEVQKELELALQESSSLSQQLRGLTNEKHILLSQIESLKAAKLSQPALSRPNSALQRKTPIVKSGNAEDYQHTINNEEDYNTGNGADDQQTQEEGGESMALDHNYVGPDVL